MSACRKEAFFSNIADHLEISPPMQSNACQMSAGAIFSIISRRPVLISTSAYANMDPANTASSV